MRRRHTTRTIIATLALPLVGALIGCGSDSGGGGGAGTSASADAKEPIVIGAAIAETGPMSGYDTPATVAAQFAADDIN